MGDENTKINLRNSEHYMDTTAAKAIKNIEEEEKKFQKMLRMVFDICELFGFEVKNRIVFIDKKTGRIWK